MVTRTRLWQRMGETEGVVIPEADAARLARLVPAAPLPRRRVGSQKHDPVVVPAGGVTIAEMMRGDRKARGAPLSTESRALFRHAL
jgi:hypothetical protein